MASLYDSVQIAQAGHRTKPDRFISGLRWGLFADLRFNRKFAKEDDSCSPDSFPFPMRNRTEHDSVFPV